MVMQSPTEFNADVPRPTLLSANTLIGTRVKNPEGADLGNIEELMIDLASGRIRYAVLSFGGFLGIGDKLFAVPWEALEISPSEDVFVLDARRETLKSAPGFDKNHWPDMADPMWESKVHSHYGVTPYWQM